MESKINQSNIFWTKTSKFCLGIISFSSLDSSVFIKVVCFQVELNSLRRRASARNVSFRISLRWPIHFINPVDKTKLRYSHRRSTTVSLETYPLHMSCKFSFKCVVIFIKLLSVCFFPDLYSFPSSFVLSRVSSLVHSLYPYFVLKLVCCRLPKFLRSNYSFFLAFIRSFVSSLPTCRTCRTCSSFVCAFIVFFLSVLVDGGWSTWSSWNTCSKSCATGQQERTRNCTKPSPSNGGRNCVGPSREDQACNTQNCPGDDLRTGTSLFVLINNFVCLSFVGLELVSGLRYL